jgi:hypothetical protein
VGAGQPLISYAGTTTTEAAAPFAIFERCAFVRQGQGISHRAPKALSQRYETASAPVLSSPETRDDCIPPVELGIV